MSINDIPNDPKLSPGKTPAFFASDPPGFPANTSGDRPRVPPGPRRIVRGTLPMGIRRW